MAPVPPARRVALLVLLGAAVAAPAASAASLYTGPGPRPGPRVLYAPPAAAPQLANGGVWRAAPILVSGASAYRAGEFVYQDFLYDDLGAGDAYRYPDDPRYAGNAADLVEVRVRPLEADTAIRLTYGAMADPALVGATIGLGDSDAPRAMPHGAGAREPARLFVTVHGTTADAVDAATGLPVATALPVAVDVPSRQVEVRVPYALFDPRGAGAVRIAAAAGLWDQAADRYVAQSGAAFFNVAFRFAEPGVGFRTSAQAAALATGDLSAFHADVDFAKLAAGVDDDLPDGPTGVPQSGFMDRILVSAAEPRPGRGDPSGRGVGCDAPCALQYGGRLQPYEVYVPPGPPPAGGYGLTLDLHGCGNTYNVGFGSGHQRQLGDRAGGASIVLTPEARGDCYWYYGRAGADVFEAWADVARRYPLDPDRSAVAGISMGGYGAYRLAASYPDLFARAAAVVPCTSAGVAAAPGAATSRGAATALLYLLPALRTVPVISWQTASDATCPYAGQAAVFDRLDALGYAYSAWTFTGLDHSAMAAQALAQSQPLADYLGAERVQRDPPRVTYVVSAAADERRLGMGADHAHWVSRLRLRRRAAWPGTGTIDVVSHGFGLLTPPAAVQERRGGELQGRQAATLEYTTQGRAAAAPVAAPVEDRLEITAENVATATIDVARAHVTCDVRIDLVSDGPFSVRLAGCTQTRSLADACEPGPRFVVRARVPRGERLRAAELTVGGVPRRLHGRRARVSVRGRPDAVARLRVTTADARGRTFVRTTQYRWCRR